MGAICRTEARGFPFVLANAGVQQVTSITTPLHNMARIRERMCWLAGYLLHRFDPTFGVSQGAAFCGKHRSPICPGCPERRMHNGKSCCSHDLRFWRIDEHLGLNGRQLDDVTRIRISLDHSRERTLRRPFSFLPLVGAMANDLAG